MTIGANRSYNFIRPASSFAVRKRKAFAITETELKLIAAPAVSASTVIVRGTGNTTGVGLVEIYNVP